jgi:FkbM family methyltransferase
VAVLKLVRPSLLVREWTFKTTSGLYVRGPLSDTVYHELFVHGTFEWASQQVWTSALGPGCVALDVGAHVGSFTLTAAQVVGPSGRVFAFEPSPTNRARLERNVRLNGFTSRVTVFPYALLDRDTVMGLSSPDPSNTGMSSLGMSGDLVECRRLDDILQPFLRRRVAALKIDVEGSETQALTGGLHVLARTDVVIAEVNDEDLLNLLRREGFSLETARGEAFVNATSHRRTGEALNVVGRRSSR